MLARDWSKHVTWPNIPQLKLGNIREYSPFFKTARVAKKISRIIKTIVAIWGENMLGYLSLDIICSSYLTVFLELRSRKTVRFSKQIMSADKYPSIFSRQMATIVYLLYSWRFSHYSAPIHWLVHGHMKHAMSGQHAKTTTSNGKQFSITRKMLNAVAVIRGGLL